MSYKTALYLHRMLELDAKLCVRVNKTSQYRWVRALFRLVSRLGDGIFWYALILAICLFDEAQGKQVALHMTIVGIVGTCLYQWLKGKTLRPRPYEVRQDIWLTGRPLDRFSFPSGHTLHAVAFSSLAISYYPWLSMLLVPYAVLVAFSRVILGLHYPSDVVAGATLGAALSLLSFPLLGLN